ncbi:MAG: sensor histidine kinase [Pirellulales bacterium]
MALVQDIAARKHAEQEREKFIEDLEQKNDELERFTYTVSHDLKSPLVTIKSYAGLLKEDLNNQDYDEVEIDLNSISSACDTLKALLDDLLALSKVGRVVNPSEWISLRELVEVATFTLQGRIRETRARVSVAGETGEIFGDRSRLLEVFQNLIDNAMKYRETKRLKWKSRPLKRRQMSPFALLTTVKALRQISMERYLIYSSN